MAFLPEFEFDIFISYARVDNETASGGEGWVAQFVKHLEVELSKLAGRIGSVKLWWDPTLDDNQLFDVAIKNRIDQSALFVSLTSNGYLKSDYCRKELRWFRENAEKHRWGLKVGERLRVVNVMLNNIPPSQWHDEFQGAIGSKFNDADREEELGYPPQPGEELFRKQLRKLSESIYRTLEEFKSITSKANSQPTLPDMEHSANDQNDDGSFLVFLADVSESLETRRELVANELRQQGIKLIESIPPPHQATAHKEKVKTEIARADLAVHLLDHQRGSKIIDAGSLRYPQVQVELGLEHAKSQLIWVPQALDQQAIASIEDPAHRDLLNKLENGDREQSSYRFIRESPSAIAREVLNQLKQLEEKKRQQVQAETLAALVDTHLKDQMHAWDLGRALTENRVMPFINPPLDDPALSLKILEERLRQVSRMIILFGEVTEDWVRARLGEALNVAARTPGCPLKSFAVCFAPPQKKEKGIRFDLNFMPVQHFNLQELLNSNTLAEFLKS